MDGYSEDSNISYDASLEKLLSNAREELTAEVAGISVFATVFNQKGRHILGTDSYIKELICEK